MTKPKNPNRWQHPGQLPEGEGSYSGGIHDPEMLTLFGIIMASWTHIEEMMIDVVNLLVFVDHDIRRAVAKKTNGHLPGRQIFRSMSANAVRAKMMQNLLRQFIGNHKKDDVYDEIISEFQTLSNRRNEYIHGLSWTGNQRQSLPSRSEGKFLSIWSSKTNHKDGF